MPASTEETKKRSTAPARAVLIAGNVGVGKSTLFEALCPPRRTHQREIPDTSLQLPEGTTAAGRTLIDAPGISSLFGHGEDEAACRHLLLSGAAETILVVLDAKKLRRSLALALQLAEFGRPLSFLLNMMDEAENRGIEISTGSLRARLGAGVRWAVLVEDQGLDDLEALLSAAAAPLRVQAALPGPVERFLEQAAPLLEGTDVPPRALGLLLLADADDARDHVVDNFRELGQILRTEYSIPLHEDYAPED